MALFQTKPQPVAPEVSKAYDVAARIQQRRYQMLVHSLLYYELDINLVSDDKWAKWALELVELQKSYPDIAKTVIFAKAFEEFDGSTGFDLPYRDEQVVNIARRLLRASGQVNAEEGIAQLDCIRTTPAEYKGWSRSPVKKPQNAQRKVVKKSETPIRKKLF